MYSIFATEMDYNSFCVSSSIGNVKHMVSKRYDIGRGEYIMVLFCKYKNCAHDVNKTMYCKNETAHQ